MEKAGWKLLVIFLSCHLLLLACTTDYQAPVNEVGSRPKSTPRLRASKPIQVNGMHQVSRGETLFSIAFQHDLEYSALARSNAIVPPYTIFPGQLLKLETSRPSPASKPQSRAKKPVIRKPIVKKPVTQKPTAKKPIVKKPVTIAKTKRTQTSGAKTNNTAMRWAWPGSGKVIGSYSSNGVENKGINIAGKKGDAVLAAEAGEVVYAGSALLRYGNLLIIKHNTDFLSAYAHNNKLLVKEGDKIRRGQKIATLGSTGIKREMLHFEIRQKGVPVDPMLFLPPR